MSVFDGEFTSFNRRILKRLLCMIANVLNVTVSVYIIYPVMYLFVIYFSFKCYVSKMLAIVATLKLERI